MTEKEIITEIIKDVIASSGGEVTDTVMAELEYLFCEYRNAEGGE